TLYELGYFSDVRVYKTPVDGGVSLVFQVVEKQAIVSIEIKGNEELTDENIREKLSTKVFTIAKEATITNDVRVITKQYAEKGYFLATVTYTLEKQGANEVALTFHVNEGGKIQVGSVEILGNQYFSDL